ncbi:UNVERIFIED_CONTAM: Lrp/AsnC family transcriptional regulator [Comamonas sp. A-3]|jgi:DNA-binding Lrp family transcriptional regulator|uniref:Lrp/AsnC family transcriptional regulator n=1 Tax=Comamonas thiooxydans TaxID=363952 RepID=A0AA42Q2C6_9BURK|nr:MULTISPECIES: Lrp/AsnC family transcriptional regulator [Comamonas]ACY31304.1 transcriptional regulator, AsnC family [Comamonas thiooxydans]EFI63293.1 transcriptional regulator, AsnC family protein [Comamonas thiooxydans]MDH1335051.1 Lrp/AsnC family transcriptional regulator [Comamonas thiooxydans]MDH1473683.1 Lrp/AsnC family transcriptional regulator [Comamonas thiooxydans]MDH1741202.1 Lrp/AsnC family transcriptional regulator [Comamonas thiooxydans]
MNENSINLDDTDLQLLQQLQLDSSLSNQALARHLELSAPTCLRRVKRLQELGLIEKQVAILSSEHIARLTGHGLQAIVEVSLDRQDSSSLLQFEHKAVAEPGVQQCWRVSPGPDFILVIATIDMPAYLALSQKLFTQDANVRNVKAFFSIKRAKFSTELPLPVSNH